MSNTAKNYSLHIVTGSQMWDIDNDNIDVEVTLADGRRFFATFFTLENIKCLFAKNKRTGECVAGLYLWSSNMILVEKLTEDAIRRTIDDLMESGEFEVALRYSGDDGGTMGTHWKRGEA